MEIVGDYRRLDGEQILEVLDPLHERVPRLIVLQVTDMVAHENMALFAQAKSVLEMGAAREDGLNEWRGQRYRLRRIATRAADQQFLLVDRPRHRIVAAHMNLPIMN